MPVATVPEQIISKLLVDGVTAIGANLTILDGILADLSASDLTAMKEYYASNPPNIVSGYARLEGPFPCATILLMNENTLQDYIGQGEEALLGPEDQLEGSGFKRHISGQYGIHLFAEHPDVCVAYYRVLRRILNVGTERLISNNLFDPQIQGMELTPDAKYSPDQLFVRRLTLTVEYEEEWNDKDQLAVALGLARERGVLGPILHEDFVLPGEPGVHPI